ncbi:MAG: hypothetical protein HYT11_03835 [Candidatus Levybacteria bacterium]|nr:hypothetical protein [Candidatus Levybacteria bacterium]
MGWDVDDDYDTTNLQKLVCEFKTQGIIPATAKITFVTEDSNGKDVGKVFNNPDTTLIYKSGMPFISYSKSQYRDSGLEYGAIVTANDCCSSTKEINILLKDHGYTKIHEETPPKITLPWASSIKNVGIFRKQN